jgi:hypothetical protein
VGLQILHTLLYEKIHATGMLIELNLTKISKYFLSEQELKDCRSQMTDLTNRWYEAIRVSPNEDESEENDEEKHIIQKAKPSTSRT